MTQARWLVRTAAVLVGLVNLVVLAHFFGGNPVLLTSVVWRDVSLSGAMPYVLVAVVAGLGVSEVAVRRFDKLSAFGRYIFFDKLSYQHAGMVGAVCLGGALMGFGTSCLFVLQDSLIDTGTLTLLERAAVAVLGILGTSIFGVSIGAALGAIEGLLLTPRLAAILGRPEDGSPSSRTTA